MGGWGGGWYTLLWVKRCERSGQKNLVDLATFGLKKVRSSLWLVIEYFFYNEIYFFRILLCSPSQSCIQLARLKYKLTNQDSNSKGHAKFTIHHFK